MAEQASKISQYEPLWREWKIDDFLGAGSYGKVYRIAREKDGKKEIAAVKYISIPKDEDEERDARENFGIDTDQDYTNYLRDRLNSYTEEINLMQKLSTSDHIVRYEASSTEKKQDQPGWDLLIRMECLTPLNKKYFKEHSISRRDVVKVGIDICKALISCQEQNIIHRDVKIANIFVDDMGNYKLGDFGVSRVMSGSLSASRTGTLDYIAPEVEKHERYDSNVDIYSLGIALYKLLNNMRNPFLPSEGKYTRRQAEEANEIRLRGEQKIPKPMYASSNSRTEKKLAEIVLKACEYDKRKRYQNPETMLKDLQSIDSKLSDEVIYGGSLEEDPNSGLGSIKTIPGINFMSSGEKTIAEAQAGASGLTQEELSTDQKKRETVIEMPGIRDSAPTIGEFSDSREEGSTIVEVAGESNDGPTIAEAAGESFDGPTIAEADGAGLDGPTIMDAPGEPEDGFTIVDTPEVNDEKTITDQPGGGVITEKKHRWLPLVIALFVLIGAGGIGAYAYMNREIPVESIALGTVNGVNASEAVDADGILTMGELEEKPLTFVVEPEDNTDTLKFTSSDESVVTVKKTGADTVLLKGVESEEDQHRNAVITVTAYDKDDGKVTEKTINVMVLSSKAYVTGIQGVNPTGSVYVSETMEIRPIVEPDYATNKDLVFISSDESVAALEAYQDESGNWYCIVKGVKSGTATIKVRSNDRSDETKDASVEMTVTVSEKLKPKPQTTSSSSGKSGSSSSSKSSGSSSSSSSSGSKSSSSGSFGSSASSGSKSSGSSSSGSSGYRKSSGSSSSGSSGYRKSSGSSSSGSSGYRKSSGSSSSGSSGGSSSGSSGGSSSGSSSSSGTGNSQQEAGAWR